MSAAATVAAVASAAVAAYGAYSSAEAQAQSQRNQAKAMDYQAQIDERNAVIADQNATSTLEQANAREEQMRRNARRNEGQAMAAIGQSGTGYDGSNLAMLEQNAVNAELDALNIRYEGDQQAKGLAVTADNSRMQSQLDKMNASQLRANANSTMTGGYLSAGSMLLSATSKYYTTKASFK